MLTIGVDAHKRVHAAVAIDGNGRELTRWRGGTAPADGDRLQAWAAALAGDRRWGIEGSGQYGHALAQQLVAAGEPVVEVNPRLTATMRRGSRGRGKSDRLDALAVARVVAQEGDALPTVLPDDASAVLAELTADRESARTEATRLRNQLHQVLHQLDPTGTWPDLTDADAVEALTSYRPPIGDALATTRANRVRHLAARLALALRQAAETAQLIIQLSRPHLAPLRDLCGVGDLSAGMLAGYLGGRDFTTDAQLASYAGVAPLEASSGEHVRHRLNRGGHRQLNALFHRIVLVQSRCRPETHAYLERRQGDDTTKAEAIRALKRFVARAVFRAWQQCTLPPLADLEVPLIEPT